MSTKFDNYASEGNTFLKLYAKDLNLGADRDAAMRILSAIFHGLRDVISTEESLQFISQLPMFLKALYVNGWSIKKKKRIKTMEQFIDVVRQHNGSTALHDFGSNEKAENYIKTTFIALRKYVSLGELEDIRTGLPKDLKSMVYQNIMF